MTAIVVGLAGAIGSGKTTISASIAEALHWPRVSFGDFVRAEARRRNLDDTSREVLQGLGEVLIAEGWNAFCAKVVNQAMWQPGQSLVVEGIRHAAAVHTLRALVAPVPFVLIFLNADEETRRARLQQRGTVGDQQQIMEAHSTEIEVATHLPNLADVLIQADKPRDAVLADVLVWLDQYMNKGIAPVA